MGMTGMIKRKFLSNYTTVKTVKQFMSTEDLWFNTRKVNMMVCDIPVTSVIIKLHNRGVSRYIRNGNMKVCDIPATSVSIRQQQRGILRNTKKVTIMVCYIHAISVSIKQPNNIV